MRLLAFLFVIIARKTNRIMVNYGKEGKQKKESKKKRPKENIFFQSP